MLIEQKGYWVHEAEKTLAENQVTDTAMIYQKKSGLTCTQSFRINKLGGEKNVLHFTCRFYPSQKGKSSK